MSHNNTNGIYLFETGIYRPPSEGGSYSLLLRVTRNCPWNQCEFCGLYKGEKFEIRQPEEVKSDIDSIFSICEGIRSESIDLGYGGRINREAALAFLEKVPELQTSHGFVMVYEWLLSGGRTAFLQDANTIVMPTEKLVDILKYLRKTFSSLVRVTSYGRSKTLSKKTLDDLIRIRNAGLDRVHVGLESGDDVVLKKIRKGATSDEHIDGGKKAIAAGIQLSEFWIPGLGGKEFSHGHASNTARVLNEINPHYIRTRPFNPFPGSPLGKACEYGDFEVPTLKEKLVEVRSMVEKLDVTSKICFDHTSNCWRNKKGGLLFSQSYEGYQLPDEKKEILRLIEEGLEYN